MLLNLSRLGCVAGTFACLGEEPSTITTGHSKLPIPCIMQILEPGTDKATSHADFGRTEPDKDAFRDVFGSYRTRFMQISALLKDLTSI
jgi:hypothetical protein